MDWTKRRWIVLTASCLANFCVGSLYAWSVFATPMTAHLTSVTGRTVTDLSLVFTVANCVPPVAMITGGMVVARLGPKLVNCVGGTLFGLGMLLSGFSTSVGMLVVCHGVVLGLGMGMVYGCNVSNCVKIFPERRGFAGGLATAAYGISSVLFPPVANALISRFGVALTFKLLGLAMLVVLLGCSLLIAPPPPGHAPCGQDAQTPAAGPDKNWRQMMRDPVFYVMLAILCSGAFAGLMAISQASPVAQQMVGMSASAAAMAVSVLALLNTAGRVLAGHLSDRIGILPTLRVVFVTAGVGLCAISLSGVGHTTLFLAGLACVGFSFGSVMGVFPSFTATQFGAKNNSVNYGIMFFGFAAAGYFGPAAMSAVHNATGSYRPAFWVAAVLSALGFAFTFLFAAVARRTARQNQNRGHAQ